MFPHQSSDWHTLDETLPSRISERLQSDSASWAEALPISTVLASQSVSRWRVREVLKIRSLSVQSSVRDEQSLRSSPVSPYGSDTQYTLICSDSAAPGPEPLRAPLPAAPHVDEHAGHHSDFRVGSQGPDNSTDLSSPLSVSRRPRRGSQFKVQGQGFRSRRQLLQGRSAYVHYRMIGAGGAADVGVAPGRSLSNVLSAAFDSVTQGVTSVTGAVI